MRPASRRPVAQGSGQALRALARRAGGRLGIGVFRKVWRQQGNITMKPILELHASGLREGETLTFRIEPVGPNESSPNWHEVRQAILSAFY